MSRHAANETSHRVIHLPAFVGWRDTLRRPPAGRNTSVAHAQWLEDFGRANSSNFLPVTRSITPPSTIVPALLQENAVPGSNDKLRVAGLGHGVRVRAKGRQSGIQIHGQARAVQQQMTDRDLLATLAELGEMLRHGIIKTDQPRSTQNIAALVVATTPWLPMPSQRSSLRSSVRLRA